MFDQRIPCYSIDPISKRNWFRIFLFFLQANLSNEFVCYNDLYQPMLTYLEFLCRVSTLRVGDQNLPKRKGRPVHLSIQKRNHIQQTLASERSPSKLLAHMSVAAPRESCRYCSTKANPVLSSVKCSFCDVLYM